LTARCGFAGKCWLRNMHSSALPEISVIIPTYNQADLLREALKSLSLQTFGNWEAIVINNFSEDGTIEVVQSFHDERLKLVNFRNHGVIGASRNEGFRHARADLIAFLDSDDAWENGKLERVRAVFQANRHIDLVCHDEAILRHDTRNGVLKYGPYNTYFDLLFKGNCLSTSAVMVRRSCFQKVGGFSEAPQFVGVEDYDLWMRLAKAGCRFQFLHELLGTYRIHGQAFTSKIEKHLQQSLNLLQAHFGEWQPQTHYYRYLMRRRWAGVLRGSGRSFMLNGERGKARHYLVLALRKDPLSWKTWALIFLNFMGVRA